MDEPFRNKSFVRIRNLDYRNMSSTRRASIPIDICLYNIGKMHTIRSHGYTGGVRVYELDGSMFYWPEEFLILDAFSESSIIF